MWKKTAGDGLRARPERPVRGSSVKEFRAAVVRPFLNRRLDVGVNMLIAGGYTGQTIENFYPSAIQQWPAWDSDRTAKRQLTYKSAAKGFTIGNRGKPSPGHHQASIICQCFACLSSLPELVSTSFPSSTPRKASIRSAISCSSLLLPFMMITSRQ